MITESTLAAFEVFLNQNCDLPESIDFGDASHLRALCIALDRFQTIAPLLVLALREKADALDAVRESFEAETAKLDSLSDRHESLQEERDKLAAEVEALKATPTDAAPEEP